MTTRYYVSPTAQATAYDDSTHATLIKHGYIRVSFWSWLKWCQALGKLERIESVWTLQAQEGHSTL